MTKKQLGQFFTKNSEYILNGLNKFTRGKNVIDPFAGNGDLLRWSLKNGAKTAKGYEIDRKFVDNKSILLHDSILNPLEYDFVITNPPYLNVNKADKRTKNLYFSGSNFEDLYQLSLAALLESKEGIVIVPINFLSAENSKRIRKIFLSKFLIDEMNYFRERVFVDTTYNVIAFHYKLKNDLYSSKFAVKMNIYPDKIKVPIELKREHDWTIGGEVLASVKNEKNILGIRRLTTKDIENEPGSILISAAYNHVDSKTKVKISDKLYKVVKNNIMLLKAIDSGTLAGRIAIEDIRRYGVDCLISKETSRHMIHLLFENKPLTIKEQERLIDLFNKEINYLRENHLSLFLTNYRDKDRKRISFDFVYKFLNHLYVNKLSARN